MCFCRGSYFYECLYPCLMRAIVKMLPSTNDEMPITQDTLDGSKMDIVPCFCHPVDMLCEDGGCELTIITRYSVAWRNPKSSYPFSLSNTHR